ncbi:MAG: type I DNA topoisomerase [Acidobacteria bacterium]|nr:type I DNA topoisomerase [Acidobacteriota bacterium]
MAGKSLVIVESPTKAKTITKFLGPDFIVRASNGHVRDLPESASDIPAKYKKETWSRLGVNVDSDFEPIYVVLKNKRDHMKDLQDDLKKASTLYLATDEDREGESISWHLHEVLKPKIPVKRLVFHEITKEAIQQALAKPREIDFDLVRAQETRRIVDRLFGYEVSPLLWKKMAPGLSAGRVQSVAVRLLVERERARIRFRSGKFWGLKARLNKPGAQPAFDAELVQLGGKRVATGRDFDPDTGLLQDPGAVLLLGQTDAERVAKLLQNGPVTVKSVEEKPFVQKPAAPFVTSSMQIEANSKLRYSARRTMQVAQQLYENGFITYMRTDSTTLSDEAIRAARGLIKREYGDAYLPAAPRLYETKVKNAQEAHEAIRPAGDKFVTPETVRAKLGDESFRLYDLIYKRTVACQMSDARGTFTNVAVEAGDAVLRASGKTIAFPGFLKAYVEDSSDDDAASEQERILPPMASGDPLKCEKAEPSEKQTQPPARFTEGSLIKELERLGIGRPSTWASIVDVVLNRSYAFKKGSALVPTWTAMGVVNLLEGSFANYLDYTYTARLEDDLDAISRGESDSPDYLRKFYFGTDGNGLRMLLEQGERDIDPRVINGMPLRPESEGKLEIRIGRYGPFVSDGERRGSVPEDLPPDELTPAKALDLLDNSSKEPESVGLHPQTGEPVYLKVGRFGPYVQLGDAREGNKPKMASLVPGTDLQSVDLDHAVRLLALPRVVGTFPDNSEPIKASNGRFGPYIQAGTETRSLPSGISPLDVTLDQAIDILRQPRRRAGAPARQTSLKDFGVNPASGKAVKLLSGRYGPYVTDGEVNATVVRGQDPMQLTPEQAYELLAARAAAIAENGGPAPKGAKRGGAKKATKKAAAKKTRKTVSA